MAMTDNVQIPLKGADVAAITDSLARVKEAIAPYQKPMFLGGPSPGAVLGDVIVMLDEKLKSAAGPLAGPTSLASHAPTVLLPEDEP